jgi:ribosomal protein S18 acetylase RimI-like enzyme
VPDALSYSTRRQPAPEQVARLFSGVPWAGARRLPEIRKALKHSDILAGAWAGRELVGFARVSTDFTFRAVLWDVIVDPSYAGKGVGTRVVQSLLRHPKLRTVDQFWLYTSDKQGFYERLGFQPYPDNTMRLLRGRKGA